MDNLCLCFIGYKPESDQESISESDENLGEIPSHN